MQEMSRRNQHFTDSVIRRMTRVSLDCGAINLAQGFPDFDPPKELTDRLKEVSQEGPHQYPITMGAPNFRRAVSRKCGRFMGIPIDPDTNIVVTIGSTEAMVDTIFALTNPGDKIVMFSPYFENYRAQAIMADCEPVFVPLVPPSFHFDPEVLEDAFRQHPKAILICNPSNPSGKVCTYDELKRISELCIKYDAYAIMDRIKQYHDFNTVGAASPLMEAAVVGLEMPDEYYRKFGDHYAHMKGIFTGGMSDLDIPFTDPEGTYFVLADIAPYMKKGQSDVEFCVEMAQKVGVACVPGSSFFDEDVNHIVRLHFAKKDETLLAALDRLSNLRRIMCG